MRSTKNTHSRKHPLFRETRRNSVNSFDRNSYLISLSILLRIPPKVNAIAHFESPKKKLKQDGKGLYNHKYTYQWLTYLKQKFSRNWSIFYKRCSHRSLLSAPNHSLWISTRIQSIQNRKDWRFEVKKFTLKKLSLISSDALDHQMMP